MNPAMELFGFTERFKKGICVICEDLIVQEKFTSALAWAEYQQSGLCQTCQDVLFLDPEEETIGKT